MATPQYSLYLAGGGIALISTQSTSVPLSTTATECQVVQLQGISTNTSVIMVANSTARVLATSRVGVPVYAGSTSVPVTIYARDLSQVYIDGISTEGVSYAYYTVGVPS